ncbi:UNVERIFIED_CONTAM: hypothetical protein GTU68_005821 [Idotea baltica]|nr:hypothetical protein [Idotea baltica]
MEDWIPFIEIDGDAGFDLRTREEVIINPGCSVVIGTGLRAVMPKGIRIDIRDKSGIASKMSCYVLAGVVDTGYRGEISVCMRNGSTSTVVFARGSKIAQAVPVIVPDVCLSTITPEDMNLLEDTERGVKGGITGVSATGN